MVSLSITFLCFLSLKTKIYNWYQSPFLMGSGEWTEKQFFHMFFFGEGYDLWTIRMQLYLEGLNLWEVMEDIKGKEK